ncbi:hypothetical protein Vqi01_16660 [Micromonospora qiuiae]|uniref:Uncharacterized protein n=1 Tax=Micromonospora qiuiae TaxID=502268 RepID=A0ABQ4J8K3_9ACTN|nr:hypothetical protein [Micromonospora qiuiae]GIJ26504.1 hypothetical protein Vqi01_16660 [Micromonospora qiuiae]
MMTLPGAEDFSEPVYAALFGVPIVTLAALGLIRRGDQRHTAFLPTDRLPVVYDLAMERRRPLPGALGPFAEPHARRPAEVPPPATERGEACSGGTVLDHQGTLPAHPPLRGGCALPTDPRAGQCPKHRGALSTTAARAAPTLSGADSETSSLLAHPDPLAVNFASSVVACGEPP